MLKQEKLERDKTRVLFSIGLFFSVAFSFLLTSQETVLIRSDHFSRMYAAQKLLTEQRRIYDPRNGQEVVSLNTISYDPIEGSFFYPAHLLVFLLPFAKLPYSYAHFIWIILSQGFLLLGIWSVYQTVSWPRSANQLTLLFLLFWACFERRRWGFLLGFGAACLGLWLLAEYFEPNWVKSFIHGVQAYSDTLHPPTALSQLGLPDWITIGVAGIFGLWLLMKYARCDTGNAAFSGCLVLNLGIWWILVPVLGMMHLVAVPIAAILLFPALENKGMKTSRPGLIILALLYAMGLSGFIYGLWAPAAYGLHIQLAELAYKVCMPILIIVLAAPLCLASARPDKKDPKDCNISP